MTDEKAPPFEGPVIDLKRERVLCSVHGEPFREGWPAGFPLFVAEGFRRLSHRDDVVDELAKSGLEVQGFCAAYLDRVPICCRLGRDVLFELYCWINEQHKYKRWPRGRCVNCKNVAYGGPFQATRPATNELKRYKHICLKCVVYNVARGNPNNN